MTLNAGETNYGLPLQPYVRYEDVWVDAPQQAIVSDRVVGRKIYESSDHLGNVRVTYGDRKLFVENGGIVAYELDVASFADYYAFGYAMPGRKANFGSYRYGFNGKEQDPEVKGTGLHYDYGFRVYDLRLGRFLSVDPLAPAYPWYSSYHFAGNMPIWASDLDGLEPKFDNIQDRNVKPVLQAKTTAERDKAMDEWHAKNAAQAAGVAVGVSVLVVYFAGAYIIPYIPSILFWSTTPQGQITLINVAGLLASVIDPNPAADYPGNFDDVARGLKLLFKNSKGIERFVFNTRRFDFFFGKGTGTPKNVEKSLQRAKDLATLGIKDNKEGEKN